MNKETFKIINPSTLYNPTPNAYSHVAVVQNFNNIIHVRVKVVKIQKVN